MNLFRLLTILSLLTLTTTVHSQTTGYSPERLYSAIELLSDYNALTDSLDEIHPAIYRYSTKAVMRNFEDSIRKTLTHPMTGQEFLTLIQLLHGHIKDGHTMILPGADEISYLHTKAHLFPFSVSVLDGQLYITGNNSADGSIPKGESILSINGVSASNLLQHLLIRRIGDGPNQHYPVWQLDHYFPSCYYMAYGEPASFSLELRHPDGKTYTRQVRALTRDSMMLMSRTAPVFGKGIFLDIKQQQGIGILTIPSLDPDLLLQDYKQVFEQVIDDAFQRIQKENIRQLIVDLRDNQGGDFEQGRYLLSYLTLNPTQYLTGGGESRWIKPHSGNYTGQLILLINGGSFSNTVIVSSTLQRDRRGIFVGEETGGNRTLISGDPKELILPRTNIIVYISTTDFHILDGFNDGKGVLPDYPVSLTPEDIRTGRDPIMEKALELAASRALPAPANAPHVN